MIWFNNLIAGLLPYIPRSVVGIIARKYIAGEELAEAVQAVQDLKRHHMDATMDLLGETPRTKQDCLNAVDTYSNALDAISTQGLSSGISLKISHMGLKLDKTFALNNIRQLVGQAHSKGIFVRIDMEESGLKSDTLQCYKLLSRDFDNVGVALQAYMRSAIDDVTDLINSGEMGAPRNVNIRLCKGAYYWESPRTVFKDPTIINSSYVYLLEKLLTAGCFTAIATHDEKLVFEAMKLIDRLKVPKDRYEFQMLYGVTETLRSDIISLGHPMRVYVPFGQEWFAYCVRRLKENPKIISYILSPSPKNG